MTRPNRALAIRGVKEQGTFAQRSSEVMRQILGDEADDAGAQNPGQARTAGGTKLGSGDTAERRDLELGRTDDEEARAAATAKEAQRAEEDARAAAAAADAKRELGAATKGNVHAEVEKKTPEQLAEIRRSGSRQAVYTRKKDNRGMVKVGFSATRAFDLRLQEFTALFVDDTRNEWLMRTIDDAMNDQREKLIARRKRIHDLAQSGKDDEKQ
jgi:hypothetical protein